MALTTMFQTCFSTAERMRDALERAGFGVEVLQAEPGKQEVVCSRGTEQVVLVVIDPAHYAFSEFPRAFFAELSAGAKGYLVLPLRPGWIFHFALEIAWHLQNAGFLVDGPQEPPVSAQCPKCGTYLRSASATQCFHCGAAWHEERPS